MSLTQSSAGACDREFIAFRVGAQEFCIDIMSVREIRGWAPATALPHAPPYVRGVINLRGAVLPIVDLAQRLGFAPTEAEERQVVIVVQVANRIVGLQVDGVSDILAYASKNIQPTPQVADQTAQMFLRGVLAIDGRMIGLVALDDIVDSQGEAA